jgi:Subtilase family
MSRRRPTVRVAALVLFCLAGSTVMAPTAAAVGPVPGSRPSGEATRFHDLDAAVSAGIVDPSVLTALRGRGTARAVVTLDSEAALASAAARAPQGRTRGQAIAAAVRPQLAAQKRAVFGAGGRGISLLEDYENIASSLVDFRSAGALLAIANRPDVTGVRENRLAQANLIESLPLIDQPEAQVAGYVGAGTSVAVLDTGLDYTRAAFGGCTAPGAPAATCRVPFVADFATNDNELDDPLPLCQTEPGCHGTNVSGIVAGVAPGARVIGLDVFEPEGSYTSDQLQAIDWVIAHQTQYNIRAINMSLGAADYHTSTCYDSPVEPAFASLRAVGVVPVVAAGNGAEAAPGYLFKNGISSPACTRGALSVGAVYDGDINAAPYFYYYPCDGDVATAADQITCFSQTANILGMLAPGAMITAAQITQGGTSQAAPHVAGAVAVLAAAKPAATATQIQTALTTSGPAIVDARNGVSKRRLDLDAAVGKVLTLASTNTFEPQLNASPGGSWSWDESLARTVAGGTEWLHSVHTRVVSGTQAIEFQRSSNNGASWSAPVRLNPTTQHGDNAVVAASGTYVHVAWRSILPSGARVIYVRSNANHGQGAWSAIRALSPGTGRTDFPSIAASGTYVYVTYTDGNTGAIKVHRSANNGTSWAALVSPGTTAATNSSTGSRWGMPEVAASGTNMLVAWRTNNAGALQERTSLDRGTTWKTALILDTDTSDHGVAALGSRLAVTWTDPTAVRLRVGVVSTAAAGANWQTVRVVAGATISKPVMAPAVGLQGNTVLGVSWSTCKTSTCAGTSGTTGIDLFFRESATSGATWKTTALMLASSSESVNHRVNDASDIEYASATERHVMYNGWTPSGAGALYMRTGFGA